jgi:hypothetical protein
MSRLPQLERLLVEEARRQDRQAGRTRRSGLRLFLSVLLIALAGGSVAVAATHLLPEGRSVPAPKSVPGSYVHRYSGPDRVLTVRAADPDGGLPWGLRVTRTRPTGGMACAQVGRVQDERLGVIGRDGAFGDDGRFHLLPKALVRGCGGLDARGRPSLQAGGQPAASGIEGWSEQTGGCELPAQRENRTEGLRALEGQLRLFERRGQTAEARTARRDLARERGHARSSIDLCAPGSRRTVFYGFAGPNARVVTLTEDGQGPRTVRTSADDSGAYLFVLRGTDDAHRSVRISTRFASGRTCPAGGPGQNAVARRACEADAGYDFRPRSGKRPTATQRALARMAAQRARARKHPLDVPVRGLPNLRFRFVPPLRGLHDYQVQIACSEKNSSGFVTPRLQGGRTATVNIPGPLGPDCHLPAEGTVSQAGTGRAIGTFTLPAP